MQWGECGSCRLGREEVKNDEERSGEWGCREEGNGEREGKVAERGGFDVECMYMSVSMKAHREREILKYN